MSTPFHSQYGMCEWQPAESACRANGNQISTDLLVTVDRGRITETRGSTVTEELPLTAAVQRPVTTDEGSASGCRRRGPARRRPQPGETSNQERNELQPPRTLSVRSIQIAILICGYHHSTGMTYRQAVEVAAAEARAPEAPAARAAAVALL